MSGDGESSNLQSPAQANPQGEGKEQPAPGHADRHELAGGICHRVKNDLQTMANLLALAAPYAKSTSEMAEALEGRVGAISVSYTLVALHGSPPTLDRLAEEVVRRSKWRLSGPFEFINGLPPLELSLRLCSPLSLWLHEVVVNALEHGLRNARRPTLAMSGGLNGEFFRISVEDNGPGLPPGFDPASSARFGLKVAQAVARSDLRGQMNFADLAPGLQARLELPAHEFENLNRILWT